MVPKTEPMWTARDVAKYLGISPDSVYDAARRDLRHLRIGPGTIRFRKDWVDAWIEQHATTGTVENPSSVG